MENYFCPCFVRFSNFKRSKINLEYKVQIMEIYFTPLVKKNVDSQTWIAKYVNCDKLPACMDIHAIVLNYSKRTDIQNNKLLTQIKNISFDYFFSTYLVCVVKAVVHKPCY